MPSSDRQVSWPLVVALLVVAACESAKSGVCAGGRLVPDGDDRYCVYDADEVTRRGGEIRCPTSLPVRLAVGDGFVCSARAVRPEELPDDVCEALGDECAASSMDAGLDASVNRDARMEPDARVSPDTGPAVCRGPADCDDGMFCNGRERCAPEDDGADPMGCAPGPTCLATQTCDEAGEQCVSDCGVSPDADGDGAIALACGGGDCDDSRRDVQPRATEVCDAVDQDCDGAIDDEATCPDRQTCEAGACVGADDWGVQLWADIVAVAFDSTGRVVVGGQVHGPDVFPPEAGEGRGFVAVYETDGSLAWVRRMGESETIVSSVAVDAMDRVVVGGKYQGVLASGHAGPDPRITTADVFVATYESDGTPAWAKTFPGIEEWESCIGTLCTLVYPTATVALDDMGRVYALVSSEGLTFGSETLTAMEYSDAMLLAFERDGTARWAAQIGSAYRDLGGVLRVDGDTVFVVAPLQVTLDLDGQETLEPPGAASVFIASFGTDGSFRWAEPLGSADAGVYASGVTTDASGNPCISGGYGSGTFVIGRFELAWTPPMPGFGGGADAFVACFDRDDGSVRWARGWGNAWADNARGLGTNAMGELVLAGDFRESVTLDAFTATSTSSELYCQVGYFAWLDASSGLVRRATPMSEASCAAPHALAVSPSGALASVGGLAGLLEIGSASVDSGRISRAFVLRYVP